MNSTHNLSYTITLRLIIIILAILSIFIGIYGYLNHSSKTNIYNNLYSSLSEDIDYIIANESTRLKNYLFKTKDHLLNNYVYDYESYTFYKKK